MIRIERSHAFHVPVSQAFAYITSMNNWAAYWPDFVRIPDPAQARWGQAGDSVTIVVTLLNRERELHLTLEEFRKDSLVAYSSRQSGLPNARHERHFRAIPEGFEYRLVVTLDPRQGLAGVFDRLLVRRAVAKALDKTIANLDRVFRQH